MSRDETFLARWSKRKRASATPGTDEAEAERRSEPGEDRRRRRDADDPRAAADATRSFPTPEGASESEPLPRLEDLLPDSDLSAFLRDGVPDALRQAAIRRMWTLDPAIRDFIGPADYAWDYNDPGSIPGFGPASGILRGAVAHSRDLVTTPEPTAARQSEPHTPTPTSTEPMAAPERPAESLAPALDSPAPETSIALKEAEAGDETGWPQRDSAAEPRAPRHGSAAPR